MNEKATLERALVTIKKLKNLLNEQQRPFEPIAITGLSCRFPQAIGKNAYWKMLCEGRNVISKIPQERWDLLQGSDEIDLRDHNHPYWGGWLQDISLFDAYFFGISPREAIRMDPQHRLILEVAHEAIEDAGIAMETLAGSNTGVFASLYVSQLAHLQKMDTEMDALYLPTGNAIAISANRLSYLFDLHGPSIIIDSACSSSMTSLSLACLNLQTRACDVALVCGAKLNLLPYVNYVLTKAKMLSPDGQCKTFDESANGYVQGEGVGVVVLKPLAKALQDKDRIYSVITGCAVNQDGRTNGLTAPNGLQQESLLETAYRIANVSPSDVSYVECHGTGTYLGDPIEIQALGEVLGRKRTAENPLLIGSVKTNIGHLEPAAGMASIIKVALSLYNAKIPPHLNCQKPNTHINFDKYHLKIAQTLQPWPKYNDTRIAGLSGFGFGGTNAHVVMREAGSTPDTQHEATYKSELFTVSAKNEAALNLLVVSWYDYLQENSNLPLETICYNLHVRRNHYPIRLALIVSSTQQLLDYLLLVKEGKEDPAAQIFKSSETQGLRAPSVPPTLTYEDLPTLASLYVNKAAIEWQKIEKDRKLPQIDLPLYPWQHKSYWPPLDTKHGVSKKNESIKQTLSGRKLASPLKNIQYEFEISKQQLPDLADTYNIFHAGYYLELMAIVVNETFNQSNFILEDHQFLAPILVADDNTVTVQVILTPEGDHFTFQYFSAAVGKSWIENAKGRLIIDKVTLSQIDSVQQIKARCIVNENSASLYERITAMGMPAGESIRWTNQYWLNNNEILCEFKAPATATQKQFQLGIHPSVFDAAIQPLFKLLPSELISPFIAAGAKKLHFNHSPDEPLYLWGKLSSIDNEAKKIIGDCYLINPSGRIFACLEGITLAQLDNKLHSADILKSQTLEGIDFALLDFNDRVAVIKNFLREQISLIFSVPPEDINDYSSLQDLGIDSLMALVLVRAIEVGLNVQYNMQELLEGPVIQDLANSIAKQQAPQEAKPLSPVAKSNSWLPHRVKMPQAKIRLFCFPYGGGGASIYRDWQSKVPPNIEVCAIQLPGREERLHEQPIEQLSELTQKLMENFQEEFTKPFIFFGHSFGSLILFELTRLLRDIQISPQHLFVSGFPDPRVPAKSLNRLLERLKTINLELQDLTKTKIANFSQAQINALALIFNENGIVGYGDYLFEKEVMKMLLPIFRGDMNIVKSYQYYDTSPLDVPITVFAGKQDAWVAYEDHFGWKNHTVQTCELMTFDASHMFVREETFKRQIIDKIVGVCAGL
jgi:acyl transferase domain-containing protein/surfactin synthase thioesterase subunit